MGKLKHFEIRFNSDIDVYYPGDVVRGELAFELRNELRIRSIKVSIRGVARVHWTEAQNSTHNLAIYTEHINSEHEYLVETKTLYDSECNNNNSNQNNNNNNNNANNIGDGGLLRSGRHRFEFTFQLPTSGISTSFEGKYGNVRYWIKAEIEKPWSFDYRTKKAFTLISPIDINRSEYLVPLEKSIEKTFCCLWCTSGHIGLYAKTERIGYCPGESIAINAEFENHTRRTIIPQATLHQTQLFLASGKVRSRTIKFTTVTGIAIQPHKTATWDGQMLKIPPISPSILNCRLIRVEYMIRISLHIPLGGYRCSVDLPIVIGTVPFNSTNHSNGNSFQATPPPLSLPTGNRVGRQPRPYLGRSLLPSNHCRTSNNVQERTQNHHNHHHHHHHHHHQTQQRSNTPPPTYAECISGSVDIDDEDEEIIGNTRFTPRYIYVNSQRTFCPPPAYSETDPFPTHCNSS